MKLILGGGSDADDLADLSRMIGDRTVRERSESWGTDRSMSYSESDRQRAILDPAMIRELCFGYGLMLLRSAKPIMLRLQPWTGRRDAGEIETAKARIETAIRETAAGEWENGSESEQ